MLVTQSSCSCCVDSDRRQKKLCYIRTVSLALALILLVTTFTQPVSAKIENGMVVTDLLDTGSIKFGTKLNDYSKDYIGIDYFSGSAFYFNWYPPEIVSKIQYIYVTFYTQHAPARVVLYPYTGGSSIWGTLVGSYDSYYQYRFPISVATDNLTLLVRYSEQYAGYLGIVSAQAYSNIYEPVTKINFYQYSTFEDSSLLYRENYSYLTETYLPYASTHVHSSGSSVEFFHDDYYIDIPQSYLTHNTYDSVIFVFDYSGILDVAGVSLYSSGADYPSVILSDDSYRVKSFVTMPDQAGITNDWEIDTVMITVDLSGYDLAYYTLSLQLAISPITGSTRGDKFTYLNVRSIYLNQEVHEPTWYQTFWSWLSSGLKDMTNTITNKMDELFGDGSGGALAEAGSAMSNQAAAMDQAQSELNSVSKPSVDAGSMLDQFTNFDTGGLSILSCITSNSQVTAMLTVTFTFCLCGYIFFGKKR